MPVALKIEIALHRVCRFYQNNNKKDKNLVKKYLSGNSKNVGGKY